MLMSLAEAHQLYLKEILIVPLGEASFVISGQRISNSLIKCHIVYVCV